MRGRIYGPLLAALVATASALALSPAATPTIENTAGAWLALSEWGTHYRIVLDGHGGGIVGFRSSGLEPQLYKIVGLTFVDSQNLGTPA